MKLTAQEQAMLDGAQGAATAKAMQILTTVGDIFGARKMLRLDRVHVASGSVISTGEGGVKWMEWLADNGGMARCMATVNPGAVDPVHWKKLGIPREYFELQQRLTAAFERMNVVTTHCCTPYLLGNIPRFGECLSSGESSAIAMYNGFFGARTNRQGGPSSIASAITGLVPAFGLLLDENRSGDIVIEVSTDCRTLHDFSTLGYFVGKLAGERIPVFVGLEDHVTVDNCKMLCAGMNTSGAVPHFHIVGMTPEAPTLRDALGGSKPQDIYRYDEVQREAAERRLCFAGDGAGLPLDMVVLGCPHASVSQIQEIVALLGGRSIHPGVLFQVLTSDAIKALCDRQGYTRMIEDAGGLLLVRTCPTCYPLGEVIAEQQGIRSLATDSAKMAHYISADSGHFPALYGTTARCIEAAINGFWQ